ncbi:MAG: gamma-glutamyl-phosphate reductase, partial [Proteobacteria bacterium]|nr:gamma-glutamyl-phosphate reductase [Pseudomonadota bacterium]
MTTGPMAEVLQKAKRARDAAAHLALMSRAEKDHALLSMADALEAKANVILAANADDVDNAKQRRMSSAPIDRLLLNAGRISEMADGLRSVARLADPVGEVLTGWRLPNGLEIAKVRVPIGVVGIIYE